jgi:hypothetical protein
VKHLYAFLQLCCERRVIDAIRRDVRAATWPDIQGPAVQVGWETAPDSDEPDQRRAIPIYTPDFSYIDLVRWLQSIARIEAELFLQRVCGGLTFEALGQQFGRDEFWAARCFRLLMQQLAGLGLGAAEVRSFVTELARRHVEPLRVVRGGRGEGRSLLRVA